MIQHFFLPGPLPGLNEIIAASKQRAGSWTAYADMKRMWSEIVFATVRREKLRPVSGLVRFHFQWQEPNRRRDPDNVSAGGKKFVLDGLVAAGILAGDGWRHVAGWSETFTVIREHPGVWVELISIVKSARKGETA